MKKLLFIFSLVSLMSMGLAQDCCKERAAAAKKDGSCCAAEAKKDAGKKDSCAAKTAKSKSGECCNTAGKPAKFKVYAGGKYYFFGCAESAEKGRVELMAKFLDVSAVQPVKSKVKI